MFVLTPEGVGLLLEGSLGNMMWTLKTALVGIAGIAGGASTWLLRRTTLWERLALVAGGLLLVYSNIMFDVVGLVLVGVVVIWQKLTMNRMAVTPG
jgi:TRAP-type uncharacterized transport system fused permease subunit